MAPAGARLSWKLSDQLTAYQLGYRAQPTSNSSLSVPTFYNVYDDLRTAEYSPGGRLTGVSIAGDDPSYQLSLRSTLFFARHGLFYLDLRQIGSLPDPASPAYAGLNARVAWSFSRSLEVSLQGSNLIRARHLEFGTTPAPLQLGATGLESGRSVFVAVRWKPLERSNSLARTRAIEISAPATILGQGIQ